MKLKTVHSLLTEQRQLAYIGEHINTDNLREIRNICLDIVDMTFEISEAQTKQTESTMTKQTLIYLSAFKRSDD